MSRRCSRLWLLALFASLAGLGPRTASSAPAPTRPVTLANGLEVFVQPIAGAKDVALVVVFRVGGRHDPAGKSGLAHLVEHCYVTAAAGGTPARSYEALVGRYPAGHNAQTADLHTIVAQVFPPERLEEEIKDAAARMQDLRVAPDDLAREKPRVLAELANMFDRMPPLAARNRARERVLPTPNAGRRGGLPAEVEGLTRDDVLGSWRRHYKPGNAVLALAGAVDAAASALVAKHFAPLPRGEPLPPPPAAEPRPPGDLTDDLEIEPAPGTAGAACVAYAAPAPGSPDYAAFLLFAARLHELAPARELLLPVVSFAPLDEPGALYLSVPLASGTSAPRALREVGLLHARVADVVGLPWSPGDEPRLGRTFGFLLGLQSFSDTVLAANPYGVALGLAARRVLGLDPEALRKQVAALEDAPLAQQGARLFDPLGSGASTVRVRPPR